MVNEYLSDVLVAVRSNITVPELHMFTLANATAINPDSKVWMWHDVDWGHRTNEIDQWLHTLDPRDWILVRDGEHPDDYGTDGEFYESEFRIGIVIPSSVTMIVRPVRSRCTVMYPTIHHPEPAESETVLDAIERWLARMTSWIR